LICVVNLSIIKEDDLYRLPELEKKKKKNYLGQAWWCMPVIPALGRLRQENHEFNASLYCIVKLS
jgi:hypothetical protein